MRKEKVECDILNVACSIYIFLSAFLNSKKNIKIKSKSIS